MLVDVFASSRRLAQCRRCGRTIEYAETVARAVVVAFDGPLDARPTGNLFTSGDDVVVTVNTAINPLHRTTCAARMTKGQHP
jgi:hypothetical protein